MERSTNLAATPPFLPLATNLPGQPGTTTDTDTNAIGAGLRPWRCRRTGVATPVLRHRHGLRPAPIAFVSVSVVVPGWPGRFVASGRKGGVAAKFVLRSTD